MTERLPDNLKVLYEGFSEEGIAGLFPGDSFMVDDVEFVCYGFLPKNVHA